MTGNQRNKRWRIKALAAMKDDPKHYLHGTIKGYRLGCGCGQCQSREVYELIDAERDVLKDRAITGDRHLADHGTESRYQYGCKCRVCRDEHARYTRMRRGGRTLACRPIPLPITAAILRIPCRLPPSSAGAKLGFPNAPSVRFF